MEKAGFKIALNKDFIRFFIANQILPFLNILTQGAKMTLHCFSADNQEKRSVENIQSDNRDVSNPGISDCVAGVFMSAG